MRSGRSRAGEFDGDLVGAEVQHRFGVGDAANAAGDAERNVEHGRDAIDPRAVDGAPIRARRDVVEHELVGAFVAIARGERHDVADDAVVAKLHAFDDDAVADVEAGDYAPRKNGRISSVVSRPSSNALPETVAATPAAVSARRSARSRTPPDAWNSIAGQRVDTVAVERDVRARQRSVAIDVGAQHVLASRPPRNDRSRQPTSASRRAPSRASQSTACRQRRSARRARA